MTQEELTILADETAKRLSIYLKSVLTFEEAVEFTGYQSSYLHKMMSQRKIPYYKPNGKSSFFNRLELENWLLSHRVSTDEELNSVALRHTRKFV